MSIPFSQYVRIRRICATIEDFNIKTKSLQRILLKCGYSRSLLKKAYHRALLQDRHELLYKPKPSEPSTDTTRCILTFSHQNQSICNTNKYGPLLTDDPVLSHYVTKNPSITYRRSKSLKDSLVNSHFVETRNLLSQTIKGTFPCGSCDVCDSLDTHLKATLPGGIK